VKIQAAHGVAESKCETNQQLLGRSRVNRTAPMRSATISRTVILGQKHRPLPFAASLATGSPSIGVPTLAVS
jgi:hypothetical protein